MARHRNKAIARSTNVYIKRSSTRLLCIPPRSPLYPSSLSLHIYIFFSIPKIKIYDNDRCKPVALNTIRILTCRSRSTCLLCCSCFAARSFMKKKKKKKQTKSKSKNIVRLFCTRIRKRRLRIHYRKRQRERETAR